MDTIGDKHEVVKMNRRWRLTTTSSSTAEGETGTETRPTVGTATVLVAGVDRLLHRPMTTPRTSQINDEREGRSAERWEGTLAAGIPLPLPITSSLPTLTGQVCEVKTEVELVIGSTWTRGQVGSRSRTIGLQGVATMTVTVGAGGAGLVTVTVTVAAGRARTGTGTGTVKAAAGGTTVV